MENKQNTLQDEEVKLTAETEFKTESQVKTDTAIESESDSEKDSKQEKGKKKYSAKPHAGGPGYHGPGEKPKNLKLTFKKLLKYLRGSLPAVIIGICLAAATIALTLEVPKLIGNAFNIVVENIIAKSIGAPFDPNFQDEVLKVLIKIIIRISIAAVLNYSEGFIFSEVAQRVSYKFRKDIYSKIDKLPLKYYDTTTNGEVLSYLTNDVDTISTTLNQTLSQMVYSLVSIVGVFVMMMITNWILALVALAAIPLSFGLIILVVKKSQKYFFSQQKSLGEVNGHIEEMYAGHNVVSLYNGQTKSKLKFKEYNAKLYDAGRKSQFLSGLMMPIMNFVGNLGYVAICIVGGVLVTNGALLVGDIAAFIFYFRQFNQPIAQSANLLSTLQSTMAAAERVFNFLDAKAEVETGEKVPENVKGDVEFKNVNFGYSDDNIIIHDFSSAVKSGQRVAIVGPTGAGKTTMVKLLMRFYDLNGGNILLDGVDINEYSRSGLREDFGMVLQDTWLFNGTIMDNIRYGKLSATDEEVFAASKTACADNFIKALPGGYNFVLNEEADNISQGQKQLLTIARAVLNDPKVLILDEATSNVDTRTEVLIQKAMSRLMEGRTSFIIAHRLSTIKDADKILVMRDGDIIEQGNHNELINQKGFYEQLYNSQFE